MRKSKVATICTLFDHGAIRFGSFKTIASIYTPIFIDLRILVSFPKLMHQVVLLYASIVRTLHYDRLVAIPLGSLPVGTILSQIVQKPMVYVRAERKKYGTKKIIEGVFFKGEKVVLLDDVVEKGIVKKQAIHNIHKEGLQVTDVVVLVNHPRGGKEYVQRMGIRVYHWTDIAEITEVLRREERITRVQYKEVVQYIADLNATTHSR